MCRVSCVITFCFLIPTTTLLSQNLVPNPDFEVYTTCPTNINMGEPLPCVPWQVPTGGTTDYFHACDSGGPVGVPVNIFGVQNAHSGSAYTGALFYYSSWIDYREFLQVQITSPMIAGRPYMVEFWYSLSGNSCPIDKLGVFISDYQITAPGTYGPLPVTPQLELNTGLIQGNEWKLFSACFFATGGEEWITIGNFYTDAQCMIGTGCPPMGSSVISYFYFDDVSVMEGPMLDIDLGADQSLCPGQSILYNFDPSLGDFLWQDNSTSSFYEIDVPGLYAVTLTSGCAIGSDEVNISPMYPPAPFDLGADTTICPFESYQIDLDPGLGNFEWQDGSTGSSYTIEQAGLYEVTISNACGEVSDDLEVNNYPEPIIDFEDDTIFLCEGENFEINFDPSLGEYIWQDGYVGPDYLITNEGEYSVELINPCGTDYDEFTVVIHQPPVVNLGPDITLCPQQLPYMINLSGLPDADQFLWNTGQTDPIYIVTGEGTVGVIVSNECFQDSDLIYITIADSTVNVSLPADTTLCSGETLMLDISHISGNYHWQDSSNLSSYSISQNGLYSVTVSNVCGSGSDSIMVLFDDQLPALDLGPDFNLCPGEEAMIHPGLTGVNYLWNDGSTADTFLVTTADTLILSISNQCTADSDTLVINLDAMAPDAGLPDQLSLCEGDTLNIGTAILGANYLWNNGQTSAFISITLPGQYILTVTNTCGTDIDTTEILNSGTVPSFNLGPDQTICEGDTLSFVPGVTGNYNWNNGSTNPSLTVTGNGTYSLTISNACGLAVDSVNVFLSPSIPDLELGPDISICTGDTFVISPGIADVNYLWQNGITTDSFAITGSGLIELTISNYCGSNSDSLIANDIPHPVLELGNDTIACEGETVLLAPGIAGVNYHWSDGSNNASLLVTASDTIQLEIENQCGMAQDSIIVTIAGIAPLADLGNDTLLCEGQILTLTIQDPGSTVVWQDGSSAPTQVISTSGLYAVSVSNSCGEARDTINVTILSSPAPFDLGPDQVICKNQTVTLNAPDHSASDILNWNTGSTASSIDIMEEGEYSLTISNTCGTVSDEIRFRLDTQDIELSEVHRFLICDDEQLTIDVAQSLPAKYLWSTGSVNGSITVQSAGLYTVTISTQCVSMADEFTVVEDTCDDDIYIPNIFSPNSDQVNDEFKIGWGNFNVSFFEISIYDRWGGIVFNSTDPNFKWDGLFYGKALNPGVFVYKIIYQSDITGQKNKLIVGDLTIIK